MTRAIASAASRMTRAAATGRASRWARGARRWSPQRPRPARPTSAGSTRRGTSKRGSATACPRPAPRPTPSPSCTTRSGKPSTPRSRRSGKETALLVDTYDVAAGRRARRRDGRARAGRGAARLRRPGRPGHRGSGPARRTRQPGHPDVVTSDLDEFAIAALAVGPRQRSGVGTALVTGSGAPTGGMVYKLVAGRMTRAPCRGRGQEEQGQAVGRRSEMGPAEARRARRRAGRGRRHR